VVRRLRFCHLGASAVREGALRAPVATGRHQSHEGPQPVEASPARGYASARPRTVIWRAVRREGARCRAAMRGIAVPARKGVTAGYHQRDRHWRADPQAGCCRYSVVRLFIHADRLAGSS